MAKRKITVPTLEFTSTGVPRWYHPRGTQSEIALDFEEITDVTSYTFESQISEVDTGVGVEPTDGTPEKSSGESRQLLEVSKVGSKVTLAIPKQLGTTTGNDGSATVTGPSVVPTPGKDTYYYISIRFTDTGVGNSSQSWDIFGQIALQYSVIDQ